MNADVLEVAMVQLPEPDFLLIDWHEDERAEGHDRWHVENPDRPCEFPDRRRSSHRPGRLEGFWRYIR